MKYVWPAVRATPLTCELSPLNVQVESSSQAIGVPLQTLAPLLGGPLVFLGLIRLEGAHVCGGATLGGWGLIVGNADTCRNVARRTAGNLLLLVGERHGGRQAGTQASGCRHPPTTHF